MVKTSTQKRHVYILRTDAIKLVFTTFIWAVQHHEDAHTQIMAIIESLERLDPCKLGKSLPEAHSLAGVAIVRLAIERMRRPLSEFESVVNSAFQEVIETREAKSLNRPPRVLPRLIRLDHRDWETHMIGLETTHLVLSETDMRALVQVCSDWGHHSEHRRFFSMNLGFTLIQSDGGPGFLTPDRFHTFQQEIRDSQECLRQCAHVFKKNFWPAEILGLKAELTAPAKISGLNKSPPM